MPWCFVGFEDLQGFCQFLWDERLCKFRNTRRDDGTIDDLVEVCRWAEDGEKTYFLLIIVCQHFCLLGVI